MNSDKYNSKLFNTFIYIIDKVILPLTEQGVSRGNKVFGAAILKKKDLSLICAGTNNEMENPLFHGEIVALNKFFAEHSKENPKDCLFLSTHEPCSMCLSAITWGGFDNIFYLFSHEESRDQHQIPHDLNILWELFSVKPGAYNRENGYWTCCSLESLLKSSRKNVHMEGVKGISALKRRYKVLSDGYQEKKEKNKIPLN
ncbi:MAG: nucleoside deaminase [Pseudomonadota bacterium]|nr:nucleoside deaminase [Pseudomonadota bacterium]